MKNKTVPKEISRYSSVKSQKQHKGYQLRYEKWPKLRECHSGRLIILVL